MTAPPSRPGRRALFLDLPQEETPPPAQETSPPSGPPETPMLPEALELWSRALAAGEWSAPPQPGSLPSEYATLARALSAFWDHFNSLQERESLLSRAFDRLPYPAVIIDKTGTVLAASCTYRKEVEFSGTVQEGSVPPLLLDEDARATLFEREEVISDVISPSATHPEEGEGHTWTRHMLPLIPSAGGPAYALITCEEGFPPGERGGAQGEPGEQPGAGAPTGVPQARTIEDYEQEIGRLAEELAAARSDLARLSTLPGEILSAVVATIPLPALSTDRNGVIQAWNELAKDLLSVLPDGEAVPGALSHLPFNPETRDLLLEGVRAGRGMVVQGSFLQGGATQPCTFVLDPFPPAPGEEMPGLMLLLLITGPAPATGVVEGIPGQGTGRGREVAGGDEITDEVVVLQRTQGPQPERVAPLTADVIGGREEGATAQLPGEGSEEAGGTPGGEPVDIPPTPAGGGGGEGTPTLARDAGKGVDKACAATGETAEPVRADVEHRPHETVIPPSHEPAVHETGDRGNIAEKTFDIVQFELAGEEYALDIRFSREIVEMMDITPIPRSPVHIAGVMNLRGEITTIINITHLLGLEGGNDYRGKKIIILSPDVAGGENIGIIVDDVRSVLQIRGSDVEFFQGGPVTGSRMHMRGIIKLAGGLGGERHPGSGGEKRLVIWLDMQEIIEEMLEDVLPAR